MKKLFMLIFACSFVTTVSFAQQMAFSAYGETEMVLARGDTRGTQPNDPHHEITGIKDITSDSFMKFHIGMNLVNRAENAGFRGGLGYDDAIFFLITGWWRISRQLYVAFGEPWGPVTFSIMDLTGWGIDKTEKFIFGRAFNNNFQFWANGYAGSLFREGFGLYPGPRTELPGMHVGVFPLSWFGINSANTMTINLYFPYINTKQYSGDHDRNLLTMYLNRIDAQLHINISKKGDLALTYSGNTIYDGETHPEMPGHYLRTYADNRELYLHWRASHFGFRWEFGLNYTHVPSGADLEPLKFGMGWEYGNVWENNPLVLNARLALAIPLTEKKNGIGPDGFGAGYKDDTKIGFDFVLNRTIAPNLRLYIPLGIGLIMRDPVIVEDTNFLFAWHFSPFIVKRFGWMGNGFVLHAGLRIFNGDNRAWWPEIGPKPAYVNSNSVIDYGPGINVQNKDMINWSVPVVFGFSL
jgi:hypothetical protein